MIEDFYTTTFTTLRQVYTGNKSSLTDTGVTFRGHLQQAQQEQILDLAESFVLTHTVWCDPDTDINVGDQITDGIDVFNVKAIQKNNYGDNPHLEVLLERSDSYVSA